MLFSKSTISQFVTRRKLARLKLKIESEETFLNLSYFYNLTQLISRLLLCKARACPKRKSLLAQGFSWYKSVNIIIPRRS